nr:MAG TPA: hypothetical protein [Caudoviricetes sp.]
MSSYLQLPSISERTQVSSQQYSSSTLLQP